VIIVEFGGCWQAGEDMANLGFTARIQQTFFGEYWIDFHQAS
jgi:hypothetical protein